jgi:hypothetical protein
MKVGKNQKKIIFGYLLELIITIWRFVEFTGENSPIKEMLHKGTYDETCPCRRIQI